MLKYQKTGVKNVRFFYILFNNPLQNKCGSLQVIEITEVLN